ncbi:hypothetical protein L1987_13846 [Smallanthus sonchifolius]|uniref:Uncharacterized protein n=1 Tax=Smallanthus sonchifolius TaxID=185202 RepID=A0ACB9JJW2_9ASTR|nr:hypothetical protein L1987_13846 [Smallanthus sonchifolius]
MGDKEDKSKTFESTESKVQSLHLIYTVTNIQNKICILDGTKVTYTSWVKLFKLHIQGYKVADHIDGTAPPDETDPTYASWAEIDAIVLQWIYGTLSDELLPRFLETHATARDAWFKIQNIFLSNRGSRAATLEAEFSNLTLAKCSSMEEMIDLEKQRQEARQHSSNSVLVTSQTPTTGFHPPQESMGSPSPPAPSPYLSASFQQRPYHGHGRGRGRGGYRGGKSGGRWGGDGRYHQQSSPPPWAWWTTPPPPHPTQPVQWPNQVPWAPRPQQPPQHFPMANVVFQPGESSTQFNALNHTDIGNAVQNTQLTPPGPMWYMDTGASNHITANSCIFQSPILSSHMGNIFVGNGSTLPIHGYGSQDWKAPFPPQ